MCFIVKLFKKIYLRFKGNKMTFEEQKKTIKHVLTLFEKQCDDDNIIEEHRAYYRRYLQFTRADDLSIEFYFGIYRFILEAIPTVSKDKFYFKTYLIINSLKNNVDDIKEHIRELNSFSYKTSIIYDVNVPKNSFSMDAVSIKYGVSYENFNFDYTERLFNAVKKIEEIL